MPDSPNGKRPDLIVGSATLLRVLWRRGQKRPFSVLLAVDHVRHGRRLVEIDVSAAELLSARRMMLAVTRRADAIVAISASWRHELYGVYLRHIEVEVTP